MVRTLVVAGSLVALGVGVGLAASSEKGPSHSVEEVIEAFSRQGIALAETRIAPGGSNHGAFFFPAEQDFYVFVARNDALAGAFFEPLGQHPDGGSGAFDMRRGNVVASSDASLTEKGLQAERRHRIRVAMDSLGWDRRSFEDAFDRVEVGMFQGQVLGLLGRPAERHGGNYQSPFENTPTEFWYYGPNNTIEESNDPSWTIGFRDGKVLTLEAPEE